tara:strand:- start:5409 stop:5780 length:372 start_codon:yes stop_codon:yes gene_type:complete
MPLTELTKITSPGIKTDTNWVGNHANFTGVCTATKFVGDGSDLTSLPAGLGTALSAEASKPLNSIFYVNDTLHITENSLVELPTTSSVAYTQFANVQVEDDMNLTINDNVEFVPDILSLSDFI